MNQTELSAILESADRLIQLNQRYQKRLLPATAWSLGKLLSSAGAQISHQQLFQRYGPAFCDKKLREMCRLYEVFPSAAQISNELSLSHYRILMQIPDDRRRAFYLQEALSNQWTTTQLRRQLRAAYFERFAGQQQEGISPGLPHYVLEFAGAALAGQSLEERKLEDALLDNLQDFLLEMGKGFAFVGRQKRLVTESGKVFYIDLVFYHFLLKCFVLVDLKIGELTHADIGQMDMYVRLYEEKARQTDDNPTVGMILCTHKDHTLVKYSMLKESRQVFASTYQLHLPEEQEIETRLSGQLLALLGIVGQDQEN